MNTATLQQRLYQLANKIDSLSLRERTLLCVAVFVGIFLVWKTFLYGYYLSSDADMNKNILALEQSVSGTKLQISALSQALAQDPNGVLRRQVQMIEQQNVDIEKNILEITKQFPKPKEVVQIIKNMIDKTKGLTVVSLEGTGSVPLFPDAKKSLGFQIFQHGVKLEMMGDYFDVLAFLSAAENQGMGKVGMKVQWDKLTYEVMDYPIAKITILMHTLSLEAGWIGV